MTPADAAQIMRGRAAAVAAEQDMRRMVAHELANLIGYAFHDPRHMPEFRPMVAQRRIDAQAAQQKVDDAKVRGWFMMQAMRKAN